MAPISEWHVVATVHGQQFNAEAQIAVAGWQVFNPLHLQRHIRKPPKIVPLFVNYLFVGWHPDRDWGTLKRLPYVWSILMSEPGRPAVVPVGVVEDLMRRSSPRRVVDDPAMQLAAFQRGARVEITAGALAGLQGLVGMNAGARVRILFELMGTPMAADFPAADVVVL